MDDAPHTDRRVKRTEQAIFLAFRELILSRAYHEISVSDIAAQAGIGRSTFYEHYRSKDEVLTHSITWLFQVLADAVTGQAEPTDLAFTVDHFFEQRRFARVLLRDRPLRLLVDRLAELIEQCTGDAMVARGIAAAQLEILATWVTGRVHADRSEVIEALSGWARRAGPG